MLGCGFSSLCKSHHTLNKTRRQAVDSRVCKAHLHGDLHRVFIRTQTGSSSAVHHSLCQLDSEWPSIQPPQGLKKGQPGLGYRTGVVLG